MDEPKRIIDLTEVSSVAAGDYIAMDSEDGGTKKIPASHFTGGSGQVMWGGIQGDISQQTDLAAFFADIIKYNAYDTLADYVGTNGTHNGVTYSFSGNKCTTSGSTSTSISFRNIFASLTALPDYVKAGDSLYCKVKTTNTNVRLAIFCYDSEGGYIQPNQYLTENKVVTIPSNTIGMTIRIDVPKNIADASGVIEYAILTNNTVNDAVSELESKSLTMKGQLPNNTDADTVTSTGAYLINSSNTYSHLPVTTGFLIVYGPTSTTTLQVAYDWSSSKVYKRRRLNTTWGDWELIGNNVINNYAFDSYSNTYNITSSPSITTDTNAYLAPSGDTTDRTADIVTMLTSLGVCRLGKGDYYVNNLEMPVKTQIIGAGHGTRIILVGTDAGYAIKMSSYCNVSDCQIVGSTSAIVLSSTVGDRHGILWQGNYTQDPTPSNQPINGMIDNVRFIGFTGGAITCYDTGYGTFNALEACNVYITNCCVGVNISYWSEFHKFTNVRTASCYYGCINNGGNNIFTNCDFSTCKLGFLMDNSQSQSPNAAHGSCVGCVFNHTDNNTGIGISILNTTAGFIFDGCQIFFSQINIEDSDGIVFSSCNFGSTNCDITIDGGGAVLFLGNMHQTDPTKTITNNNHVIFANCYVKSTGALVTNS